MQTLNPATALNLATHEADDESLRDVRGRLRHGWATTLASFIGLTLGPSTILVFCFGSFVMPLEQAFGWSVGAISVGGTIIGAMIVVTALLAGWLVDRVGGRRLVLVSIPLFGAGVASLSFLPADIRVFYAALALIALLATGIWPVTYNKLTAVWFRRRLGLSLGLANAGVGVGAALLPMLVAWVIGAHGWRTAYVVLGLLALVIPWPVAALMLREPRGKESVQTGPTQAHDGMSFAEARRTAAFRRAVLAFFILGAASSAVVFHQVRILVDTGIPLQQAAAMQSVLGLTLILGRVVTGWLLDRVPMPPLMAGLCVVAACALAVYAAGAPYGSAPLCAALTGLVIGAEYDVLAYFVARYFGRRAYGRLYATVLALMQVSAAVTVAAVGWSRAASGTYSSSLALLAVALLLAGLLFARLGPPGR